MLLALLACEQELPSAPAPAARVSSDTGSEPVIPWSHPLATPEARALLQGLIESGAARDMTEAVTLVAIADESSDGAGEWYLNTYSNLIDDPAILYANLLLMGDRLNQFGGNGTLAFDNVWGAGRLRARRWDPVGLDAPGRWSTGSVCVPNNTTVTLNMNVDASGDPQPMPTGVDYLKLVFWHYEARFGASSANALADYTVRLQSLVPGTVIWATEQSSTDDDDKKLVYHVPTTANSKFRVRLEGDSILDISTCGQNSVRVYWAAWVFEDNSRDDVDLPVCVDAEL